MDLTALGGTTVFTCPLSSCQWTQADLQAEGAGYIGMLATEQLLREHLSSHDLAEWVAEVVKLHEVMTAVAAELDEQGRIGRSLLTGAMATRANLAREECIGKIGRAIKGDGGEDADFEDEWDDADSSAYHDRVEAGLEPED